MRVAFGTGIVLGLWRGQLETAPTTAHFLTYHGGRCSANCKFCPQARESTADLKMLSRVIWPQAEFKKVLVALGKNSNEFKRVCIQAVNYSGVVSDICEIVTRVKSICDLPISVSCQPLKPGDIRKLADVGAERISIALDAATPELFEHIKGGGYTWDGHMQALEIARTIFGNRVSTHLIAGLGESEEEMVRTIQLLHDRGIIIGLFAFTPIAGTSLSHYNQPDIASYRRVQLARFLIANSMGRAERMRFGSKWIVDFGVERDVLNGIVESGEPFRTSGCPDCNRPFYNESPRGPIYSYPKNPSFKELATIRSQLSGVSYFSLLLNYDTLTRVNH